MPIWSIYFSQSCHVLDLFFHHFTAINHIGGLQSNVIIFSLKNNIENKKLYRDQSVNENVINHKLGSIIKL